MSDSIMGNMVAAEMNDIIQSESHADMFYKKAEAKEEAPNEEIKVEAEDSKTAKIDKTIRVLNKISKNLDDHGYTKCATDVLNVIGTIIDEVNGNLVKSSMLPEDPTAIFEELEDPENLDEETLDIKVDDVVEPVGVSGNEPEFDENLEVITSVNKEIEKWIKKHSFDEYGSEVDEFLNDLGESPEEEEEDFEDESDEQPGEEEKLEEDFDDTELDELLNDLEKQLSEEYHVDAKIVGDIE